MQILYHRCRAGAEIVKCFGVDTQIELPGQIEGLPVTCVESYAFSDRDDRWKKMYEEKKLHMYGEEIPGQRPLEGEMVESVAFPDTVAAIGNYVFYGCKNLSRLSFSNRLVNIGTGCFNLCGKNMNLTVRMLDGNQSCVKEILGDLWQRVDVRLLYADRKEARLLFPEHYEEARENTPARILYTHHHGSGNNYRQCFYNKEMDFRKYDELFAVGKVYDKMDVLTDLIFGRLLYPVELREEDRQIYMDFAAKNQDQMAEYIAEKDEGEICLFMDREKMWTKSGLETAMAFAVKYRRAQLQSILMDIQLRMPSEKKKFVL